MATTTASPTLASSRNLLLKPLSALATAGMLAAVAFALAIQFPAATPLAALVSGLGLGVAAWMLLTERYEWSLAVLMLYIGLADGYLKLTTGSSHTTLLRDVLLYAIAVGALIRVAVRRERLELPPLIGWVIVWVLIVAVQVANPNNGTLAHSVASVRPHVEWIPLFFLGYAAVRSTKRLRRFLLLLLAIAAVNGVVGLVQVNLSPEELASWGPGYEKAINGENGASARGFVDEEGTVRVRPFGLGGDMGFGGIVGLIAIPAALALFSLARRPGVRAATIVLAAGAVIAVATSEARVAVIGAVIGVFAFAALTVTSRAGLRTLIAIAVASAVAYATVGLLSSKVEKGTFDRYESISNPSEAVSTAYDYRRETLARIPEYIRDFPLGAGIGSKGPAASLAGGGAGEGLDAESEPTYLLIELGLPGLIAMLGLNLTLFYLCFTRIRRVADRETRLLLTGLAAPLFAMFATWFVGVTTATVPTSPYFWFAAGVLSFWLLGKGSGSLEREPPFPASDEPVGRPAVRELAPLKPRWSDG